MHIDVPRGSVDLPRCSERLCAVLEGGTPAVVVCDVGKLDHPDAGTVDGLARLRLTARRLGAEVVLRNAPPELCELLELTGMCEAVGLRPPSGVEVGGEVEEGEPARRVEEERDPADPAV